MTGSAVAMGPQHLLQQMFLTRYPAEASRCLEGRPPAEVAALLVTHSVPDTVRVWERFSPDLGGRLLTALDRGKAAAVLTAMDPNRSAPFLGNVHEDLRADLLQAVPALSAAEIRLSMAYPKDTAGALMDMQVSYFDSELFVADVMQRLRARGRRGSRAVFTVDEQGKLLGVVDIQDLALATPETAVRELTRPVQTAVRAMTTREEVVEEFEKHRVTDLPVLDFDRRLLGVIRHHTLVDVARAESSADIATMVGVSKDERALSKVGFAVRKRLPWLQINLVTAFMAAAVVGLFEDTIARYTALAVLLPVVAGQSGNTGAQALAVTMRGLALREIRPRQWLRVAFKEINVGLWNGIAIALTTAAGVYVWSQSAGLCLVIGVSMVISMIMAGLSGAAIPMLLTAAGLDPAQSSSIFVTTVTDIVGFFSFLGIATLLSGML